MLPCTTALFSSGVPVVRLFDANFSRHDGRCDAEPEKSERRDPVPSENHIRT
jgi:hypothetical protein